MLEAAVNGADGYRPPPNVAAMAIALKEHDVEFVVIGGAAAQAWGASRRAEDLDIVIRCAPTNYRAAADALISLQARVYFPEFGQEALDLLPHVRLTPELLERSPISTWMTDRGGLDLFDSVLDRAGGARYYEDLTEGASRRRIAGITVDVISLDTLIASKAAFGRRKDVETVAELRHIAASRARQQHQPGPARGGQLEQRRSLTRDLGPSL